MQLATKTHVPMARALKGDVLAPDPLTCAAHEIENMSEAEAHMLAAEIAETSDFDAFRLGGLLARIHREKWFVGAGHADFRSYVEQRHGFKLRKALYLVSIYESVIDLGLTWNELKPVGWSKLKELVGVITQDNASQWLATAAAEDMTVLKLHALVRETKGEAKGEGTQRRVASSEPAISASAITDAQFKAHMAAIGWEATLAVFEQNFPDLALTVEES
ncbi:hypothetical protein [Reyranella sp.]|uniref:hypothetical protein n=1 Tax=Reyranella sp. TaxID=1929291 RepID=UPI00120DF048|nr:hypothetical protein [Reyranella sp.]TAJ84520.1 MAG: hypothetical protein EPO50_17665 [Reyranella sp.]